VRVEKTVFGREDTVRERLSTSSAGDEDFRVFWRYAMIRLLCILGIHWEGIVVSGNLGCCTLCGEDTYSFFIVHKLERNAHGRILPRN
jgi:hypothetical protein